MTWAGSPRSWCGRASAAMEGVLANARDRWPPIEFEIRGLMWAQPVPLEMLLRTQLDLEAGKLEVRDLAPGAKQRPPPSGAG